MLAAFPPNCDMIVLMGLEGVQRPRAVALN